MRQFFNILLISFIASYVSACGTAVPSVKPYKLEIQQGNMVTSKMLLQLRPGMTKSQVRYIMGTPLIQDGFHGNRWDYFYQMREGGKVIEQRRVILEFENELLKSVRGDVIPSDGKSEGSGDAVTGTRAISSEAQAKEKGLWDKLKFWQKDEAELAREAEEAKLEAQKKALEEAKKAEAKKAEEAQKVENKVESIAPTAVENKPEVKAVPVEEKVEVKAAPVEEKSAVKAPVVEKSSVESTPKEEKGWLNKLKFWGDDEPKAEEAKAAQEKKAAEEAPQKGWVDKLKFWKSDDAAKTETKPAEASEDVKSLSGVPIIEVPENKK